jgi:shikimate dehydrogenase
MNDRKVLYGLIGYPLSHSFSAHYFNEKFRLAGDTDKEYRLFPLNKSETFPDLLERHPNLAGLNVTIPYKEKIIPYLDEIDGTARSIGAVNTILIQRNRGLIVTKGFNTDATGFYQTLSGLTLAGPALILGTGGGAKAVAHALNKKNIPFTFVSRNPGKPGILSYDDLTSDIIRRHLLIINTTPVGMFPDTGEFPMIPYQHLSGNHTLYDLIYNPGETEFLKRGKIMGAKPLNGKQMLINQAELSYAIFTGNPLTFSI